MGKNNALVQITKTDVKPVNKKTTAPVKISYGKLNIEFSNGITREDLNVIIQAFGGKDVL